MTARILENYNQQLLLEVLFVMHQERRVIESTTKEPDESWKFNSTFKFDESFQRQAPAQLSTGPATTFLTPGQIILRTPQQNGVVERRNRTLVEAAKTMLIFSKAPIALCYPTNDSEDLGKLQPTADIGIFVRYAPRTKAYKIYNKRTRRIMEIIHVQFNELSEPMAHAQLSTGPATTFLTPGQIILRTPQQNGVVERRNRTLVEAAKTMLIFSKAPIHDEVLPNLLVVQSLQEQIMVMASSFKPLKLRIFHQKSVLRTPQQNGVVERRNRTLVEAAKTILIFSKAPMFLWAKAVATA
ncbi:retrovirus-related pol polyprotein from transposon TNT 1-94 [Tanacetum coccineum]|uniref:Retrovirus-related pol polyprotein from transposon TNT 1-94 n=1 Tax=Tanacetum coccineum TaxID=301880 RepID=A0ABQ5B0K6_9ASTR